ncbi:hypothetical protein GGR50DRAFT_322342 [Xylaria sp. CBS 124048]|nr:hypothetical protein GGR50DRAFT_322342 [Xylaria sp. CBS 124048]
MRFSLTPLTALTALLLTSSGHLRLVSANKSPEPEPEPEPSTLPDSTPTQTARQDPARETTPSLLGTLFEIANSFDLRACVPAALPLMTALPKIPAALVNQGVIKQALSQTTRDLEHVCDFSVTDSVGDTFTEFLPTWYSWYHRYSDRVASVATKCPRAAALVRTMEAYEACPQVVAQISSSSPSPLLSPVDVTAAYAEGEGSATDVSIVTTTSALPASTSTDLPSTTSEAGLLGAAVAAVAGVLGVVAAL